MANWLQYIVPGLLIATRLSGVFLAAPFFGATAVPPRVKAALVLALTVLLLPVVPIGLPSNSLLSWFGDGLSELIIGVLLGLVMQVVFEAAQLAGSVAGFQMGMELETAFDPTTQADSTVLSTMNNLLALYLFLQLGVHRWILRALMASFASVPPGSSLASLTAGQMLAFAGNIWIWGLQLVMPVLLVTLLIDVTLAFFAKAAPQLPVMFVGIPVKALCGYGVLLAAIQFWPGMFSHHFEQAISFFMQHAHLAGAV